ncbi:MAG: hypothetical protein IJA19_02540, partial [Clostridia bacterium]|nr:hypothetical protein [Clostridia bacterium]
MSQQLKFAYGLSADFALLLEGKLEGKTIDEGTLYFLTDTHEIYKGSTLAVATNFTRVDALPAASAALTDMFYILKTSNADGSEEYALKILNAAGTDFIDIGGSKILKDVTIDADLNTISNLETD